MDKDEFLRTRDAIEEMAREPADAEEREILRKCIEYLEYVFPHVVQQADAERKPLVESYCRYVMDTIEEYQRGGDLKPFNFTVFLGTGEDNRSRLYYTDDGGIQIFDFRDPDFDEIPEYEQTDEYFWLDIPNIDELIAQGAEIKIRLPEEFADTAEDE